MNGTYFFSAKTLSFYPAEMMREYKISGTWPDDAIEVTEEIFNEFIITPPGKVRGAMNDGKPCWIDIPPPTKEEEIAMAEKKKKDLIEQVNNFMNGKQWPGKASIGRLKGDDLAKYNLWLDYLDALEDVDISSAPDVKWPAPPALVEG